VAVHATSPTLLEGTFATCARVDSDSLWGAFFFFLVAGNGPCAPGYYCPTGSDSNKRWSCGNDTVYCPEGAAAPLSVGSGNYSEGVAATLRSSQSLCPVGAYCEKGVKVCVCAYACACGWRMGEVDGRGVHSPACFVPCVVRMLLVCLRPSVLTRDLCPERVCPLTVESHAHAAPPQMLCPAGRYGSAPGLVSPLCSGSCTDGFQCAAGSSGPAPAPCDAGYMCTGGQRVACPPGTYSGPQAMQCTLCDPGRFNANPGAGSVAACTPCPLYAGALVQEGSLVGAAACWPGVLSANASNPPPLVPGFSVGDVVTVVFTKATNVSTNPVTFSPPIGAVAFSWQAQGTVLVRLGMRLCVCPCRLLCQQSVT
jgi:hypothetical protein